MTTGLQRLRRRVDRRVYRLLTVLYRRLLPSRGPAGRIPPDALRRVLVVRRDRVGDLVVTTPLLSFLREVAPHAEIDVLASRANRSLLDGDDRVTRVFVPESGLRGWMRLRSALRARRYDAVFTLVYGQALREAAIAAMASRRETRRVSVMRPPRYAGLFSELIRVPRSVRHMAEHVLYVGERALDAGPIPRRAHIERWPMRLAVHAPSEARADRLLREHAGRWISDVGHSDQRPASNVQRQPLLAVNLWAAEPWREWPVERLAELVAQLRARGCEPRLLLLPPPGKESEAEAAAARCEPGAMVAPPSPQLGDLVSLVRRADVVLTPDTAVVHVASACARPVVALYSARTVRVELWQPLGVPHRTLTAPDREPVAAIPATDVARALEELLREVEGFESRG